MTTKSSVQHSLIWIMAIIALCVPAIVLRVSGAHIEPAIAALVYGVAIIGGAFLLSWAAEVAQLDISASFAIAILALIALLPEYAIEAVLAWKAGASFDVGAPEVTPQMQLVAANVTGANRLLIGMGWSLVILISWIRHRRPLEMSGHINLELTMLAIATLVTFFIFFTNQVHIIVAAMLILMYLTYLWISSTRESEEPELVGPALAIGSLPPRQRRVVVALLFLCAAGIILLVAEPFVESLVTTGLKMGIDEFILIQWLAPLASESPEIIVAILFSLRGNSVAGLTTLVSAEVNQLTLLVGSMVGIFSVSVGQLLSFPLDSRQSVEFLLTAAVSIFAILLIARPKVSWHASVPVLGLFIVHLFFVEEHQRLIFVYIYLGLAVGLVALHLRQWVTRNHHG